MNVNILRYSVFGIEEGQEVDCTFVKCSSNVAETGSITTI